MLVYHSVPADFSNLKLRPFGEKPGVPTRPENPKKRQFLRDFNLHPAKINMTMEKSNHE